MKYSKWLTFAALGIAIVSLSYNVVQYNTIQMKTESNDALMDQITTVQGQISAIQENQTISDNAIQSYLTGIEAKYKDLSDHYQSLLRFQADLIDQSDIDTSHYIHVYEMDEMAMTSHVLYYVNLPEEILTKPSQSVNLNLLKTTLSDLLDHVSRDLFNYLPIEFDNLTYNGEGYTAEINLMELENAEVIEGYQGWANMYFQGSTGGMVTETQLMYAVLQPEVENWPITEVAFTYEGQTIEFDHVPRLYDVVKRQDIVDAFQGE